MRRHFTVILSILLALSAASPASAAKLKKNNVENIAAREEQEARDAVSGPAAGEASGEELQAEAGGKPGEVTGNSAPEMAVQKTEAPAGEEQGAEPAEETEQSEETAGSALVTATSSTLWRTRAYTETGWMSIIPPTAKRGATVCSTRMCTW